MKIERLLSATAGVLMLLGGTIAPGQSPVGEVRFVNSGAAGAQAAFVRGVAQLHTFESEDAVAAFVAQKADPGFAMPAGDAEAANRIVSRLRAILQRKDAKSGTR